MRSRISIAIVTLVFSGVPLLFYAQSNGTSGDLTFKSHISVCGNPISDNVLMIKDGKFRFETRVASGGTAVDIYDCPRRRWIQVSDRNRTFMVRELEPPKLQPSSSKTEESSEKVTRTVDLRDTGERKDFFGYSARHLKWTIVDKGESCHNTTIYGQGWYIDPPVEGCYWRTLRKTFSHPGLACKGRVTVTGPDLDKLAYPMVDDTSLDEHFSMTIHDEVTGVSNTPLDPKLFEVPAGYKQVDTYRELIGDQAMDKALASLKKIYAQTGNQSGAAPEIIQQLQFLVGEWSYTGAMPPECTFSVVPELNGRILVRRSNLAECKALPPDKPPYEDRTIFYADPADAKAHALILDSEGQVLHFDVAVPAPNKVVLESGVSPDGNRHRITFSLEPAGLHSKYEITRPSGEFWTYSEMISPRKQTPK